MSIIGQQRLTARVTGRVQGVGYRAFAFDRARWLALKGWVKNEWDGAVSVVAEGDRKTLNELLDHLRHGPPMARVQHVAADWSPATGEFESFTIRR